MKKKAPAHENLERWMVSYADFLTLMFAVFVVLYSFAMAKSVDAQSMIKGLMASFNEVGMISSVPGVIALPGPVANIMADASLASASVQRQEVQAESAGGGGVMDFGISQESLMQQNVEASAGAEESEVDAPSSQGNLDVTETDRPTSGALAQDSPDSISKQSSGLTQGGDLDEFAQGGVGPSESELTGDNPSGQPFDTLMQSISETINSQGLSSDVIIERDSNWITINISSSLLFVPNSASILSRSRPVIAQIATALRNINNYIRVRGYTDNSFVPNAIYGNNWELSAQRAINVLQELESNGIEPQRLAVEAYGQYSPFYSNATRAGRAQNRRVVIAISREAIKPETLTILPGDSERLVETRQAGKGGFDFQTGDDGKLQFKAKPVDQSTTLDESTGSSPATIR